MIIKPSRSIKPARLARIALACIAAFGSGCNRVNGLTDTQPGAVAAERGNATATSVGAAEPSDMVLIPGGRFRMGTASGFVYEAPEHDVDVRPFWLDTQEVSVSKYATFVEATGYRTESEKLGWSGVFDPDQHQWLTVDGANWRHPEGPKSSAKPNEPVCQVSWDDANAYCRWAGKRLPTEAEYEFAASGGRIGAIFPWGDELRPGGKPAANWWQGEFPAHDAGEDGFRGRAPVGSYAPTGYGLYDIAGNVWEWCSDWFDPDYYSRSPRENPSGPERGTERSMRGGSWMCSENYCRGYRVAARGHSSHDSALNNVGFRCVRDP